ncbi:16429_t:CDS:1 [Acaulospora morrowiae]|uniref:16429_t:CDS:1 n=1 Tax=Acaulospora morrowiae TaxID=94023 RepID=A0A9N8VSN4_9GLOM|nr:16429_t:CDS:1 [Acaulospora morrowiae]
MASIKETPLSKLQRIQKYKFIIIKLKDLRISFKNHHELIGKYAAFTRQRSKDQSKRIAESKFVASDWSLQEFLLWKKLLDTVEKFYAIALVCQDRKIELLEFLKKHGKSESVNLFEYYVGNQSEKLVDKLYQELLENLKIDADYYNICREFLYKESTPINPTEERKVSQEMLDTLKKTFESHYQLFEEINRDPSVWARVNKNTSIMWKPK